MKPVEGSGSDLVEAGVGPRFLTKDLSLGPSCPRPIHGLVSQATLCHVGIGTDASKCPVSCAVGTAGCCQEGHCPGLVTQSRGP